MTAKITIERISRQAVRVTLTADIEISVNDDLAGLRASAAEAANRETFSHGTSLAAAAPGYELLTVEETAELLHVGRDNVYYLIRTGQLRSIKIGKLRRIPRARIAELVARLESESA
jgi:excisionase family DNA binding protein